MRLYYLPVARQLVLMLPFAIITGCATISKFDQYAYTQATSLKIDALNVMGHATDKYEVYRGDVVKVQTNMDKMFEYEKNRPKNIASQKMWGILKDSSGHLFGGFIKRWQQENTLDAVFIKEAQQLVSESFDEISQLESGKIKASQITNN